MQLKKVNRIIAGFPDPDVTQLLEDEDGGLYIYLRSFNEKTNKVSFGLAKIVLTGYGDVDYEKPMETLLQ